MGSRWRKVKDALGFGLCVHVPASAGEDPLPDESAAVPAAAGGTPPRSVFRPSKPPSPCRSSPDSKLSRSGSKSSKRICAICLGTVKAGHGHALFTAECSHTFHFQCIASNVKHGNHLCPVCRAKWKEIPFQPPACSELPILLRDNRVNAIIWPEEEGHLTVARHIPRSGSSSRVHHRSSSVSHAPEPDMFDDDEPLDPCPEPSNLSEHGCNQMVICQTYPELSAVQCLVSQENFAVLIHLKAPVNDTDQSAARNVPSSSLSSQASRAPIDLVTVLDVSGSMAGTKLALLKRAMGFVIQNLGPSDRLSVIAFSSTANRLFPLRRMSEAGKQLALQAVNALVSTGGTNIAKGLKKGSKVIEDRKERNPICSIILLSDGQDTYNLPSGRRHSPSNYESLLPSPIHNGSGRQVPVHTFGFGSDHDAVAMHTISESSGGTFSFIEAENVIQNAFAQCIGGLLSVVVQELRVELQCAHPSVQIGSIKSGSYMSSIAPDKCAGNIDIGDLYADEERDFLVYMNVPPASQPRVDTILLSVRCSYKDFVSKEPIKLEIQDVKIRRPEVVIGRSVCIEVDRQRNRLGAAEAMAEARIAAERGNLSDAVSILQKFRQMLAETPSAQSGDMLCSALDAELKEMQDRMSSRQRYEVSGRAYVLSGLSSHSWQRATARGDSTEFSSHLHSYQTPSMVDMLMRSQTLSPLIPGSSPPPFRPLDSPMERR